jgi:transposase
LSAKKRPAIHNVPPDAKIARENTELVAIQSVFKSGRDFAAWLGITPRQNASGGKQTPGAITKLANRYIRKLLVLAATSLLRVMGKRNGTLRDWIVAVLAKKPARLVTAALANKPARILITHLQTVRPPVPPLWLSEDRGASAIDRRLGRQQ